MSSHRRHAGYWAAIGHRVSGIALAVFLPLHFLALGLALEGVAAFDRFLTFADNPLVKFAEWGLVVLLSMHLFFGLRVLALEFLPWPDRGDPRSSWITYGLGGVVAIGVFFLLGAV